MSIITQVEEILKSRLEAEEVTIIDDGHKHMGHQPNDPAYLTVEVVSPVFAGKSLIQQHRMVYDCLKNELKEKIHALQIKTRLP